MNKTLRLVSWKVWGTLWPQKEFRQELQSLSQVSEDQAHHLTTNWPGVIGLAGVVNSKLIRIHAIWTLHEIFWHDCLKKSVNTLPLKYIDQSYQLTITRHIVSQWISIQNFVIWWRGYSTEIHRSLDMSWFGTLSRCWHLLGKCQITQKCKIGI